ncbi:unnamed protein product [Pseudo-nitzschia multistriata]|uniref:Sulfotransferase domain-containing protein n=1 Tax=Pseudo-nitzschia multistriata TaxID=183589 RepID=A0A448Z0X6_9STRA|nr:unnamed protein product [Pseudo-nitzschia multistriata]
MGSNGSSNRRKKKRGINIERVLFPLVILMAIGLLFVNISVMVEHSNKGKRRGSDEADSSIRKSRGMSESKEKQKRGNGSDSHSKDVQKDRLPPPETKPHDEPKPSKQETPQTKAAPGENSGGDIDEHMLRILRHVGIHNSSQLTDQELSALPTWSQVVEKFGNKGPVMLGRETCSEYRSSVDRKHRKLGVAGPFSSGTHYLHTILSNNCKSLEDKGRVMFQVPWGKHQSANFRLVHNVAVSSTLKNDHKKNETTGKLDHPPLDPKHLKENKSVLPIVVVRDPYSWWQSMCRVRYSAHWFHVVPDHCPNFVPNEVEREWFNKTKKEIRKHYNNDPWKVDNVVDKANFTLDKTVVPLWVRYHSENRQHKSLAHMWADWYNDYYEANFPRLMIRLEDLVFYPHETLKMVCECANDDDDGDEQKASFEYVGDENLELSLESAIKGKGDKVDNIHGKDRTGLLGAMKKHAGKYSDEHRLTGMTPSDMEFAEAVLKESDVFKDLGYQRPVRPSA